MKALSMDFNTIALQPETVKNKRGSYFSQVNKSSSVANKNVENLSFAIGGANPTMKHIQVGLCNSIDKALQNFAQTIKSVKSANTKVKGTRNFFEKTNIFEKKLDAVPSKVLEIVREVSMRSNMKITGCGAYLCLTKDNLRLELEITSSMAKEHKYLKIQLVKGSKQKASELLAKMLDNIELI